MLKLIKKLNQTIDTNVWLLALIEFALIMGAFSAIYIGMLITDAYIRGM